MALTDTDYKAIQEIADMAYSIPERAGMFEAVCGRLQRLIPFDGAVFLPVSYRTDGFQSEGHSVFNSPSRTLSLFCDHYAPLHPLFEIGLRLRRFNEALRITDVIQDSRLQRTEYSREFQTMIPMFFELDAMASFQGEPIGAFCFHRTREDRNFTDREKYILTLLMPHLSRALYSINFIHGITSDLNVGIITLDPEGNPHPVNPLGRSALEEADGRLDLIAERGTYRVQTLPAGFSRTGRILLLHPLTERDGLIAKMEGTGLTPRQQEIAWLMTRGLSNREIADRLFIAEQTVKDHIQAIFQRLKVRRRAELIFRLLAKG